MAWHAKPLGGYDIDSTEAYDNMVMIWNLFKSELHSTDEAIIGVLANCFAESGFNPWRWESDAVTVGYQNGYGLFQFTPAQGLSDWTTGYIGNYILGYNNFLEPTPDGYINFINQYYEGKGYSPNYSTAEQTIAATPDDGTAQVLTLINDQNGAVIASAYRPLGLRKWVSDLWRPSAWSAETYPTEYAAVMRIRQQYGGGSFLSWVDDIDGHDYQHITDIYDATLAFLTGYEGPQVLNTATRYSYASQIYEILTGNPPPPSPTPTATDETRLPIWLYLF